MYSSNRATFHRIPRAAAIVAAAFATAFGARAAGPVERPAPLSQIKSVFYGNDLMRNFLGEYLQLTPVQAARVDRSLAETRLKLIESMSELQTANEALDRAVTLGESASQVDEILNRQTAVIRKLLVEEVAGFRAFLAILDGDQRYRLSQLDKVQETQVNGQPTIAFQVVTEQPVLQPSSVF